MNNPFEAIEERLRNIEALLLEIKSAPANTNPTEDKPLTIIEAAALLHLTVPTIYGLVHSGDIPHFKIKKRLYFFQNELLDYIKSGKRKTSIELDAEADTFLSKSGGRSKKK